MKIFQKVNVGNKVYDIVFKKWGVVKEKRSKKEKSIYKIYVKYPGGRLTSYTQDGKLTPADKKIRLVSKEPIKHIRERNKKKKELENKTREFRKELKNLLEKFNASIGFSVGAGSDTYGIYNSHFVVNFEKNDDIDLNEDSWSLGAEDLKETKKRS